MIRSVILLAGLWSASAADHGACALNGARAVDDMLDGATYIWASVQRCQKPGTGNKKGNQVLCAMDVSAAIESVNAMVNVILKAVEGCEGLQGENEKCGLAVGVLTRSFAGLAAASAGVKAKCVDKLTFLVTAPGELDNKNGALGSAAQEASFGECLVDVKDTVKSLFKATKRFLTVNGNCDGEDVPACAHNGLKIVAALSSMGQYLAGAIGRCSPNTVANKGLREGGQCAEQVDELVRYLTDVGRAGVGLKEFCEEGAERLYQLEHGVEMQNGGSSMTLALAALLPIGAVLGFVGGSRFARSRGQSHETLVQ